ncbi:ADP-dependent phosphofructokinase/glucokinase [Neobacillus bataviensis]|uniref:ADP-dependent phosphofructokinase/glucokinase n=1 Tax=Neobacillus bataviensis TaxID=220685 RepID=A0A561DCU3_9BACI|nr:ADP-dependent glucokinase/phosphofructokinase [Neobacillus bataviensis]TWE01230.1 ADP-dependent phosphofructokinase/glucokinase [Neobacillus bataviensis]
MRTIACGFTANIDLLGKITSEFYKEIKSCASGAPKAFIDSWEDFCTALDWNIKRGSGGEYIVAGNSILKKLEAKLDWRRAIGGTGLQAGCAASRAGYRSLVNIPIQSEELESIVSGLEELILLSDQEGDVPKHYILEYEIGGCSNRIIFRRQDEFTADLIANKFLSELSQNDVRWLLLSGYNSFDTSAEIDLFLKNNLRVLESLGSKRPRVHLELAAIWSLDEQWRIINTLGQHVDSLGVNEDEYQELLGMNDSLLDLDNDQLLSVMEKACDLLGVANFILHTKQFSLVQSEKYDTSIWGKALENGNKFAFSRALKGTICDQETIDHLTARCDYHKRGEELRQLTQYRKDITVIPAYVGEITSTIGLGDTFTAGLLVEAPVKFVPNRKISLG